MTLNSQQLSAKPASPPALPPIVIRVPRLVMALLLIALGGGLLFMYLISPPGRSVTPIRCEVSAGTGAIAIGKQLQSCGLVRSGWMFAVYARITSQAGRLQAGIYELPQTLTLPEVVRAIAEGRALSDDNEATIPEGMNIWEVDATLAKAGIITPGELRAQFSFKEGHLFPDTYRFAKDASVSDVVNKMEQNYFDKGGTRGDIDLVVASILEKEAKTPEDMALVAGIIQKRMSIGMALQVDATVGYGWCIRTKGFIRDCDVTQAPIATEIKVDGPYNTYTRTGLPQGAISNPGINALKAAANPKKSDYLYYLSSRDGSQMYYAKTLDEHLENRAKHLGF